MPGPLTIEVKETALLMKKLRSLSGGRIGLTVKNKVLKAAGKQLERSVRQNIGRTDHSLEALRNMDNPYARRHGSIAVHQATPYVIHRQSGSLSSSLVTSQQTTGEPSWKIGFRYGAARYFRYLITGTRVMLPRNVLYDTSQNEKVRKNMQKAVNGVFRTEIKKAMKGI